MGYNRTSPLSVIDDEQSIKSARTKRKSKTKAKERRKVLFSEGHHLDTIEEAHESEESEDNGESNSSSSSSEDSSSLSSSSDEETIDSRSSKETIETKNIAGKSFERLKFEITVAENHKDAGKLDVRGNVMTVFNRLLSEDPTRKIAPFLETDEATHPMLRKLEKLPYVMDDLIKYIAAPRFNEKTGKLVFYSRFRTQKPLNDIKRTSGIVEWLHKSGTWIKVTHLKTTANVRGGFFIGKSSRITNLRAMTDFVKDQLKTQFQEVSDFQLNHDTIGKDKSTRTKAVVLECAREDLRKLSTQLQQVFSTESAFPFMPFYVMASLDQKSQAIYYKSHKFRTFGQSLVEVVIPDFTGLDEMVHLNTGTKTSLRHFVFGLSKQGHKIKADIDDGTRTGETVMLVHNDNKAVIMELVQKWLSRHHKFHIKWEDSMVYQSSMFRLNPEARAVATRFTTAAADLQKEFPSLPKKQYSPSIPNNRANTSRNTWVDIAKMEPSPKSGTADKAMSGDGTATTISSTCTRNSNSSNLDFHTLRKNITKVALHNRQLETQVIENFLDDQRQYSELVTAINNYCCRLESLEKARDRQTQINQAQLKVALQPETSAKDGTLTSLMELLGQDLLGTTSHGSRNSRPEEPNLVTNEEVQLRVTLQKNQTKYLRLLSEIPNIPSDAPISEFNMSDFDESSNSDEISRMTETDSYEDKDSDNREHSTLDDKNNGDDTSSVFSLHSQTDTESALHQSTSPGRATEPVAQVPKPAHYKDIPVVDNAEVFDNPPGNREDNTQAAEENSIPKTKTKTNRLSLLQSTRKLPSLSHAKARLQTTMNNWIVTPSYKRTGSPKKEQRNESRKTPRIHSPSRENRFSVLDDHPTRPREDTDMMEVDTEQAITQELSKKNPSPNWAADSDDEESPNQDPPKFPLTQEAAHDQAQYHANADHGSAPT